MSSGLRTRARIDSEPLESRVLLSSYVVTSLGDAAGVLSPSGPGRFNASTLRAAITAANAHAGQDTISFAAGVSGSVQLGKALPVLSDDVRIFGPGMSKLTLQRSSAACGFSILSVGGGVNVRLSGLTISKGTGTADGVNRHGGGIVNAGLLIVRDCAVSGNAVTGKTMRIDASTVLPGDGAGGGIYNTGVLGMERCTISGNTANGADNYPQLGGFGIGAGIYSTGCVSLIHCKLSDNRALGGAGGSDYAGGADGEMRSLSGYGAGGAIYNAGSLQITGSTLSRNVAQGGSGDEMTADSSGGAVFNEENGYVTANDSSFTANRAMFGGGFSNSGTLDLLRCTISGGCAARGGGIYNDRGGVAVRDSVLKYNDASESGGAMYNQDYWGNESPTAIVKLSNSSITHNSSADFGGGIANTCGIVTATGCKFTGNSGIALFNERASRVTIGGCTFSGNDSGAINNGGDLIITRSAVVNNQSPSNGGGGIWNGGAAAVTNCTISGNTAGDSGGGIWNDSLGVMTVRQSTIANNSASNSGGGLGSSGRLTVVGCTISGNVARFDGGIAGDGITLHNSIVAGNVRLAGSQSLPSDLTANPVSAASSFNVIGVGGAGGLLNGKNGNQVGVSLASLKLGALQNNGGPTQTMALLPGSVAINAGSNAIAVDASGAALAFDQRGIGFARIIGGRVDVGAFEFAGSP